MDRAARVLAERRMKEVLLEAAERAGLDAGELAEWLYYAAGVRARPEWGRLRRAVLKAPISAQELAAFLVSEGVEVPEEELLRVLGGVSLGRSSPRLPRGRGVAGGAAGAEHGRREER